MSVNAPYTFVSFSADPWADFWLNRQHVMSRMALEHRVLFCSSVPSWETYVHRLKIGDPIQWRSRRVTPTLTDLRAWPWLPSVPECRPLDRLLEALHVARIRAALQARGWGNRILYIWHPGMVDMVGRFNERLVCFHVYDDYAGYMSLTDTQRETVRRQTARLLERADLVFVAGESMRRRLDRDDVHVVANAVDYELFARAQDRSVPPPRDMAGIPHPIVAHIGRLNAKIDYGLLATIARRRRDWSVLLIGPFTEVLPPKERRHADDFLAQPNAYHIPGKPVGELPDYLRHVDVALMAYRLVGWVMTGFPLKLFEYLAAGKPCVGSPIEENVRHRDHVTIAESVNGWIAAIEHWLANDTEALVEKRKALARANSWDIRCRRILELIAEKLGDGPGPSAATGTTPA